MDTNQFENLLTELHNNFRMLAEEMLRMHMRLAQSGSEGVPPREAMAPPQHKERIVGLADELFGSHEAAMRWLSSPKRRLHGLAPMALLDLEDGAKVVEEMLHQIAND
ncbi:MAG: MbcA/ParS/Xre antitoxin family protein [Betaproteobacteria bacterium]|nr:MbcA/ParS/Xre antitoxin family protein [Betaproteobacteria bacterium]